MKNIQHVEIKHGMQVADLLSAQNKTAQKRKHEAPKPSGVSLASIWPESTKEKPRP